MTKLPPDQPARDAIRNDLDVTMLVEAAAGTGKTTNLVHRMVNLVATGKARPSTIAAITFTIKAAAHLRERFHRELEAADPSPRLERGEGGRRPDEGPGFIGTTHAFCARLLRERPVEAGLDPEFKEVDQAEAQALTAEFWNRWFDLKALSGDTYIEDARRAGLDRKMLRGVFERLVGHPDVVLVSERYPRPNVKAVVDELLAFLARCEPNLPTDAHRVKPDDFEQLMRKLLWKSRAVDVTDVSDQLELMEEANHGSRKPTQKNWPDKTVAKQLGLDYAEFVRDRLRPALRAWREHVHGVAMELLRPAAEEFAAERRANGTLTFEDLLVCARDMLRDHPNVRRYFQRRFTHVLVDEFQDTDPIQAEVLMYLTGSDVDEKSWRKLTPRPGSLFIVGDPKQSIYRFRRADITTYLDVKQRIEKSGGVVRQLSTSFRSAEPICTFVNEAFKSLFDPADVKAARQADHVDLSSFVDHDADAGVFSLETADLRVHDMACAEAATVASWIRRQVEEKKLHWRDVLLVSWQTPRLSCYAQVFETQGIPYEITGSKAFKGLDDLRQVMPLLRAIVTPEDEVSVVAYLRGPLCGIDDDTLYQYKQSGGRFSPFAHAAPSPRPERGEGGRRPDEGRIQRDLLTPREPEAGAAPPVPDVSPIHRALATIREAIEDSRQHPPASAIARLFNRLGLIALAASAEQPGTRAGNLMLALSIARDLSASGETLAAIVDHLDDMLNTAPDIEELDVDPSRTDAVRLMNLHQVKGLEAPVVFLIDPADEFTFPIDLVVDRSGEESRGYFALKKKWGQYGEKVLAQPRGWDEHEAREEAFKRAERMRLLYVAATRAMRMLVVGYRQTKKGVAGAWRELAQRIPTSFRAAETARNLGRESGPRAITRNFESEMTALEQTYATAKNTSYSVLPITKIAHNTHVELVKAEEGLGKGTSWGRVLHRLFEAMLREESLDVRLLAENLLKDEERDPVELAEVMSVVEAVRNSPLWQRVKNADERYVEIPFALEVPRRESGLDEDGETLLHGTIDLVFREGDRWFIVDYKSDSTAGRLEQLVEYYKPQVEHYAKFWTKLTNAAATAGLFFVDTATERWI